MFWCILWSQHLGSRGRKTSVSFRAEQSTTKLQDRQDYIERPSTVYKQNRTTTN